MTKVIQTNFSGGEISQAVTTRVDVDKRASSLALCENGYVQTSGGISNRSGYEYVCEVKDSTKAVRVIPFEYNTEQTYILEFGDLYIRFVTLGGLIIDSSTVETISGATAADPIVITSTGHSLTNGQEVFISGVAGMEEINGRQFKVANVATNTFELQDMASVDIDGSGYTAYTSGGTASLVYEIETPYTEAQLFDVQYVQSADVMTFTHPNHSPRELTRTANDSWTLEQIVFQPEQAFPENVASSANTTGSVVERYVVTATSFDTAEESLRGIGSSWTISAATQANPVVITATGHGISEGNEFHIDNVVGMTELNGQRFKANNVTANTIELTDSSGVDVDGTGYTAYSSAGDAYLTYTELTNGAATADNTITWDKVEGAETYTIYKYDNGTFGFIGKSEELEFTDDNIEADLSDTPPKTRNPFVASTSYPSTAGFYQQRRIFGNSTAKPQRNWFTQTANFYNLSVSSPAKDSDAITATIAALRVNEVRHYIPLTDLVVLTSGGEWLITGVDDSITPSTIQVEPQSYYGSTWLKPIVAGDIAIFMQPGQVVRDLGYKFETDAYAGNDISILARHLFDGYEVVDWDFSPSPYSILWAVRDDGTMVAQTYLREQEIYGWHRHTTRGHFKSLASIRENDYDTPYVVVERHVGGRNPKYIERMDERNFSKVEDAFFVDAGVRVSNPITVTGFTAADPVVITTATSHGFSNGDTIDISGINIIDLTENTGQAPATDLNGTGYTVANVTSTTFELQNNGTDVDGTAFGEYHDGGEAFATFTVVENLWHLEGVTDVVALANGYVEKGLTVTNGKITLQDAVSRVAVGLPYFTEIQTLPLDAGSASETIQGKDKKASRVTVQVEDTLGLWTGPDREHMREAKFGMPALLGQPPVLFTGDKNVTLAPHWTKTAQYFIQQRDPLPITILAVIPDVIIGGN